MYPAHDNGFVMPKDLQIINRIAAVMAFTVLPIPACWLWYLCTTSQTGKGFFIFPLFYTGIIIGCYYNYIRYLPLYKMKYTIQNGIVTNKTRNEELSIDLKEPHFRRDIKIWFHLGKGSMPFEWIIFYQKPILIYKFNLKEGDKTIAALRNAGAVLLPNTPEMEQMLSDY